jgi:glycosyltransferase involved in cell wall biosynthesis
MKLVYILNHYSEKSPSHFNHVLHLLEVMAEKGVEIALIVEKCDDAPKIASRNVVVYAQRRRNRALRPVELLNILWKLHGKGYRHVFVRISWVAAVVSGIYGRLSGVRVFYWLSSQGKFEAHDNMPSGARKVWNHIYSITPFKASVALAHKLVTGPESMIDYFVNMGGVERNKLRLLYNDVDLRRFHPSSPDLRATTKERLGFDAETKIVFYAHRFSPVRKTAQFIPVVVERFFSKGNDAYIFVLAGSGPEETEVRQSLASSEYASRVRFVGNIPNKTIQHYYQAADIFINPTYAEGFPRVLIEAMACGLPIVTTDAGGIKDILGNNQLKYMVSKEDPESFAEALSDLAKSPEIQRRLSVENIERVKRYSTEVVADAYIETLFGEE